jgi:23S rRNA U2552 (ribose-2'-O)-methylase RlmE/FtsJ
MTSDGFLHKYFLNNSDKPLHKWMHYFDIYARHLERFRSSASVMLEIGVSGGGSLAMWKDYLGPEAKIVGIDINPACKAHEAENIEVFIGSQDDPALIKRLLEKYPRLDVVLDDGSHMNSHMIRSFELLYDHVAPRGVYMVEDTHTCYWSEYEGGLKRSSSFMEFVKDRLDDINAVHSRDALPVSSFTRSTNAICCYDSLVVFERRPQGARQAPMTKAM